MNITQSGLIGAAGALTSQLMTKGAVTDLNAIAQQVVLNCAFIAPVVSLWFPLLGSMKLHWILAASVDRASALLRTTIARTCGAYRCAWFVFVRRIHLQPTVQHSHLLVHDRRLWRGAGAVACAQQRVDGSDVIAALFSLPVVVDLPASMVDASDSLLPLAASLLASRKGRPVAPKGHLWQRLRLRLGDNLCLNPCRLKLALPLK